MVANNAKVGKGDVLYHHLANVWALASPGVCDALITHINQIFIPIM